MLVKHMSNISVEQFHEMTDNKKVVILYPRINYRNIFLSYFLADESKQTLYYRAENDNITVKDFLSGLIAEFSDGVSGFGNATASALDSGNAGELATALIADIQSIGSKQKVVLYLDEFDKITIDAEVREFADALFNNLGDDIQVVINARILTLNPWSEAVESGAATVLGTAYHSNNLIYTVDDQHRPQLEVDAFGRGHAIVNGEEIETWDGALPRNMFFYFVDNNLVTRDEIFKIFWPDLPVKEATNVFHVTKRKITERMSVNIFGGGNYELTTYSGGFYTPSDKIVRHYDVAEFTEAVDEATMTFNDDEQAVLYERAVNAYRAPFLTTIDMPWVYERREKLQRLFVEALIGLARIHKAGNRHEESLGYFVRTLKEEPQREDIYREIMQLYHTMGYKDEALRHYHMLTERLQDTLGVAPAGETKDVYQQIKSS